MRSQFNPSPNIDIRAGRRVMDAMIDQAGIVEADNYWPDSSDERP
jgi:hypothetical protein